MDPISVVGIAAAAVAFLEFSVKTLVVCKKLRDSTDGLPENLDIERRAKMLQRMTKDLTWPCSLSNPTDKRIRDLGLKCASLAAELQKLLDKIKPNGKSLSNLLKSTLRSVKEARTIEKFEVQILAYQKILDTSLLVGIQQRLSNVDFQSTKQFESLQKTSQDVIKRLATSADMSKEEHQATRAQVANNIKQSEFVMSAQVAKEHLDTRAKIQTSIISLALKDQRNTYLKSLVFPEYRARQEQVHEAHRKTFGWIFDKDQEALGAWDNFADWLRCGNDIYWIQGKPGSGKSTLMNFILEESRTKTELACWAGSQTLVCLSFFFWRPGTPLQKSRVGMLRSLLYQLLEADEETFSELFAYNSNILAWTDSAAQKKFLEALALTKYKVCIFVDGLDEFEGDFQSTGLLLDLCIDCAKLPNVKLCASSRPEVPLKRALGSCKQLRLQDLNRRDIQNYVLERLKGDNLKSLRKKIVSRADGSFVWTSLVTDSLCEGYENQDGEKTLILRLDSYPERLDDLYSHMLKRIKPIYKKLAAAYLLMAHLSNRKTRRMPVLTVLTLTVTMDDNFSSDHFFGLVTVDQIVEQCRVIENRVEIYCRGLLEIKNLPSKYASNREDSHDHKITPILQMKAYDRMKIGFTHRTAYDFIFDTSAGCEFITASLYSESDLEIRLFSGLLNQLLSLPGDTEIDLSNELDARFQPNKNDVLRRPLIAASSAQYQHQRDSILDKFYRFICSSDENNLGSNLLKHLKDLSAGNSGNGFLECCMRISKFELCPYVYSHLQTQDDQNVAPDLLSDATLLCHLARNMDGVNNHIDVKRTFFAEALEVLDLLLYRLEKALPTLLPQGMENYRTAWHKFHEPNAANPRTIFLGNIDYAEACEGNPKSSEMAQMMSLVSNSRAICLSIHHKVLKQSEFDTIRTSYLIRIHDFIRRFGKLVPDGYAWSLVLQMAYSHKDPKNDRECYTGDILMPVELMCNESIGVERGGKAMFTDAHERYIFEIKDILVVPLSAEESLEVEGLIMAQSELKEWKPADMGYGDRSSMTLRSNITSICPSIRTVLTQLAMEAENNTVPMLWPKSLQMKHRKRQQINDKL